MDRRLKWVVVVAEVAPVMTFFEWVCSGGFQIGSGDIFFDRRGFVFVCVCVCVCVCGLWIVLEVEGA